MTFEQQPEHLDLYQPDNMVQSTFAHQGALEAWALPANSKTDNNNSELYVMAKAEHATTDRVAKGDVPALGTFERLDYMIKHGQMFDATGRITADGGRAIEEYARNGALNFQSFNPLAGFDGSAQRLRYARNLINESGQHRAFGRHHSTIDRIGLGVPFGIYVTCGTSTYAP